MDPAVAAWLAANTDKFNASDMVFIRQRLEGAGADKVARLASVQLKDPIITLLLCWFLGVFGIHRFYVGDVGIGIIELLTGGVCGILAIVDLFLSFGMTRSANFKAIAPYL